MTKSDGRIWAEPAFAFVFTDDFCVVPVNAVVVAVLASVAATTKANTMQAVRKIFCADIFRIL